MRKPTEEEELEEFEEEEDEFEEEDKEEEVVIPKKPIPQPAKKPQPTQFIKKPLETPKEIPQPPAQEEIEETKQEVLGEELVNVIRELEFRITRIESRLFRATQ